MQNTQLNSNQKILLEIINEALESSEQIALDFGVKFKKASNELNLTQHELQALVPIVLDRLLSSFIKVQVNTKSS